MSQITQLKSHQVITANGAISASILVQNKTIIALKPYDYISDSISQVFDYSDSAILPGLVDSHVHVNEPGRTDWEGFDTATHAAAAGGITTVIDMPLNCIPVTITAQALADKLAVLDNKLWIDTGFWGGATADNLADLPALLDAGVFGVKSFTIHSGIDEFKAVNEDQLFAAMQKLAEKGLPHLIHAELEPENTLPASIGASYQSFLKTRPESWENNAIAMVIRVMQKLEANGLKPHAHIVHLSSASALPMIKAAREQGLKLTVETCPHYLVLAAEHIPDGQATYKCCPPIREQQNQQQLWQALKDGVIDCIVSDHSPCTPQLKNLDSGDLENAWGGISGLQFGLSLVWSKAKQLGFSLTELANLMSTQPAKLLNLKHKGEIAVGKQADFCIFSADKSYTITAECIHHKHKISPYIGNKVTGVIEATWLAGQPIYQNQSFVGQASGQVLLKTPDNSAQFGTRTPSV
ncbi:allantoinase AllB [Catenovulum sp. 2E275]|uniref:allantoinase AllB n=1 Tax=Catenovulum sp. 2E275 TaxID=2980497 RepID=UPI0021CEB2AE|nr:allantoinase AllB [Catenovulum sp. 2E275]MCU4676029.1 allantoinase AllB [Catenovulum sp. 2E275]